MPPGSANPSSRAATLTPSPKMSPSSTTMSPTLMPMRNAMRLVCGRPVLRSAISMPFGRAAQTVYYTGELDQQTVPGSFDDASSMFDDLRIDHVGADRSQSVESTYLVVANQPRVPGYISGEDSGETAGLGHASGNPAWRRPSV